jgi:hypothetical protein
MNCASLREILLSWAFTVFLWNMLSWSIISLIDRKNGLTQHQGVNTLLSCGRCFSPEFSPLNRLTLWNQLWAQPTGVHNGHHFNPNWSRQIPLDGRKHQWFRHAWSSLLYIAWREGTIVFRHWSEVSRLKSGWKHWPLWKQPVKLTADSIGHDDTADFARVSWLSGLNSGLNHLTTAHKKHNCTGPSGNIGWTAGLSFIPCSLAGW